MAIKFIPPLNWTTRVPGGVPRAGSSHENLSDGEGVRVRFTATMAEKDYAEVQRTGMRLELWTNAPAGRDEWRAIPFEEDVQGQEEGLEIEGDVLDLGAESVEEGSVGSDLPSPSSPSPPAAACPTISTDPYPRAHVFRVTLTLPPTPHQKYAFTYRIVKPAGIRWVGTDKTNGVVHVVPHNGCVLEQGEWKWLHSDGAGNEPTWLRSYAIAEGARGDFVIANIDFREKTWVGWGIGRDGRSVHNFKLPPTEDVPPSRFLYLIPTSTDQDSVYMPSPIALRSVSWKSPISIKKTGAIVLHAQDDSRSIVERRVHDVDSAAAFRRLRSEVISSSPAPQIIAASKAEKNNAIAFALNNDGDGATTIYAQSLKEAEAPRISLSLFALQAVAPEASSSVALFNSRSKVCVFVNQDASTPITIVARQEHSDFVAIPVYDINDDPRMKWQIGLSEVTSVPELITVKTLNPLPTPPASPRAKPRQNVSFVLPLEEESKHHDAPEPIPPTTNGIVSAKESRPNDSNNGDADPPLPSPSSDAPGATSLALLTKAQRKIVHRAQVTLGDGRLFSTFSLLALIAGAIVRRLFRAFLPLGVQSRMDGLVWYLLPWTTGSYYAPWRRRIERGETDSNSERRGGQGVTPRFSEVESSGAPKASAHGNDDSAQEETTTHLFIDRTIEEAEPQYTIPVPSSSPSPSPSSSLSFAPSRTESTKAARWAIPASGEHDRHGGDPPSTEAVVPEAETSGLAAPNSTLHLLVRRPLAVSGGAQAPGAGAAVPHDALYVEVDGREYPLGPDLLPPPRQSSKICQGRRALEKKEQQQATISDDNGDDPTTASPSEAGVSCSVYAIQLPEGARTRGTSILVRLRA